MGGFFSSYAALGLNIFIGYVVASLVLGFILGKILKKMWIAPLIVFGMVILFFIFDLNISPILVFLLAVVVLLTYLLKRGANKKNE